MASKVDAVFEALDKLSVIELAVLLGYIEDKWGVTASRPPVPAQQPAEQAPAERTVSVVLVDAGSSRIQVVKKLRELLDLGLKEANDLTKVAGVLAGELSEAAAKELQAALEAAGATVEVRYA